MDRVTRARILGALALAGAAALAWFGLWGPAIAVFTMGAAALLLITERDIPAALPDAGAEGAVRALAGMTRELRLTGRGTIVPPRAGETASALFVAASDVAGLPAMRMGEVVLHSSGSPGVQLPPPGLGLERQAAALTGLPTGKGVEEALLHLQRAFRALDLGRDVRLARAGTSSYRVSYEPIAFTDLCRATRDELAPWHVQGACPACSLAAILLARALGAPVSMRAAGADGTRVFLDLEAVAP